MDWFVKSDKKYPGRGFTLIELMIVVAIVGILAAVALPAYQDYTKRAHVSEGLGLAAGAKAAVADYYATTNQWPTTNSQAGLNDKITGNAVKDIQVNTDGVITITYNDRVDNDTDRTLTLVPSDSNGAIFWECKADDSNGVESKHLPAFCRPR